MNASVADRQQMAAELGRASYLIGVLLADKPDEYIRTSARAWLSRHEAQFPAPAGSIWERHDDPEIDDEGDDFDEDAHDEDRPGSRLLHEEGWL